VREALGLLALNALFLGAGAAIVWAAGGATAWVDAVRRAGIAYLVGAAALGVATEILLVAGASARPRNVVAVALVEAAGAVAAGVLAGRRLPARPPRDRTGEPLRPIGLIAAAAAVLYLADFLRAARKQSLFTLPEWDAWAFWTAKAKAVYYVGGLDADVLRTFFQPGYPILVPALEAAAFGFMGAADTTALHVQFWLFLAGFVACVAGLLRPHAPHVLIWPFVVLLLVLPQLNRLALSPQGDFVLDYFFAAAGLCLVSWALRREPWLLVCGTVLLAGAIGAKREAYLFGLALVIATAAATWRTRGWAWPRLATAALAAAVTSVPWEAWRAAHDLPGQLQGSDLSAVGGRLGPATSSVAQILFGYHFWLLTIPLGLAAAGLLLAFGHRHVACLYVTTLVLGGAGLVWVLAAGVDYTLGPLSDQNPVPRGSGALALLTLALVPLMLSLALEVGKEHPERREPPLR
jgi:hypothetical protein